MGMTREEAIEILRNLLKELTEDFDALTEEEHEAYDLAIETMRKYEKIVEIVKEWREVGLDYDSCDAMDNIERVIENGSDKRL